MPTVKLFANLRKLAGMKETSIAGATVGAVLTELVKQHPPLDGVILEKGDVCPHVIITLNGHNTNDMDAQVAEKDVMAIFPPIAGG